MFFEFWISEPSTALDGLEYTDCRKSNARQVTQKSGYNQIKVFCWGNGVESFNGSSSKREISIRGNVRETGERFTMVIKCTPRQYGNIICFLKDFEEKGIEAKLSFIDGGVLYRI